MSEFNAKRTRSDFLALIWRTVSKEPVLAILIFALLYLAWLSVPAVLLTLLILGLGGAVYRSRMVAAHSVFGRTADDGVHGVELWTIVDPCPEEF